jgi:hypothetical protein
LSRVDEGQHEPTSDPWWIEVWDLDFASEDRTVGGFVRLTRLPNQKVSWFWSAVTAPDHPHVAVVDFELPLPGPTLELRSSGIWLDLICEQPMTHYTVGLEAFGLALDDPKDRLGHRTPVGYDLEWESSVDGYPLPCDVHGEILVGAEVIDFSGRGSRSHWWGDAGSTRLLRDAAATQELGRYAEVNVEQLGVKYRRSLTSSGCELLRRD